MQIEAVDVTTIDQLTDPEVDELLARAVNPHMPIEVFYAVLERIGGGQIFAAAADHADATADPVADAPTAVAALPAAPVQDELGDVPDGVEV